MCSLFNAMPIMIRCAYTSGRVDPCCSIISPACSACEYSTQFWLQAVSYYPSLAVEQLSTCSRCNSAAEAYEKILSSARETDHHTHSIRDTDKYCSYVFCCYQEVFWRSTPECGVFLPQGSQQISHFAKNEFTSGWMYEMCLRLLINIPWNTWPCPRWGKWITLRLDTAEVVLETITMLTAYWVLTTAVAALQQHHWIRCWIQLFKEVPPWNPEHLHLIQDSSALVQFQKNIYFPSWRTAGYIQKGACHTSTRLV